MEKEIIIEYIKTQSTVTVPSIQKQFSLSYNKVKEIFDGLVKEGKLVFDSGVTYIVCEEIPEPKHDIRKGRLDSPEFKTFRSMFDRDGDDDDDDDDEDDGDESADIDDLLADLEDSFIGGDKKPELLKESEEADESGNDSEDEFERLHKHFVNIGKLDKIKRIFAGCLEDKLKTEVDKDVFYNRIALSDDRQFEVIYEEDALFIIYDVFLSDESISEASVNSIIKDYKYLSYESGEITATVDNLDNAFDALLELYAAVERIKHAG